jgi:hypothetical protein
MQLYTANARVVPTATPGNRPTECARTARIKEVIHALVQLDRSSFLSLEAASAIGSKATSLHSHLRPPLRASNAPLSSQVPISAHAPPADSSKVPITRSVRGVMQTPTSKTIPLLVPVLAKLDLCGARHSTPLGVLLPSPAPSFQMGPPLHILSALVYQQLSFKVLARSVIFHKALSYCPITTHASIAALSTLLLQLEAPFPTAVSVRLAIIGILNAFPAFL